MGTTSSALPPPSPTLFPPTVAFTPVATETATSTTATSTFTFTPTPTTTATLTPNATSTITPTPDIVAPSGFSVAIDQASINRANHTSISFTITSGEPGTTFAYTIDDTIPGTPPVTGSGSISSTSQQVSGLNISGLHDGSILLALTLRDASNNTSLPQIATRLKDATIPEISGVSVPNGSYSVSSFIPITMSISEAVAVSGFPSIPLDVGGTARTAVYHNASSTTTSIVFRYQVQSNDNDADGIIVTSTSLALNGGTITDAFNNGLTTGFNPPITSGVFTYGTASNCNALRTVGFTSNGVFQIDPDGSGGLAPFNAYRDMTTDGGGWTLILNYLHKTGIASAGLARTINLPIISGDSLGNDDYNINGGIYWGHATPSLIAALSTVDSELRFWCITNQHSRIMHAKTTLDSCVGYIRTGTGSCSGIQTNFTALSGHTALGPATATAFSSNAGNNALTSSLFRDNSSHSGWSGICFSCPSFQCDTDWGFDNNAHLQVWVR